MRRVRIVASYSIAALVGFALAIAFRVLPLGAGTTVTRLSPDETIRARFVETSPNWGLDRNFEVRLDLMSEGRTTTIFRAPDQAQRPYGTERLIWSKDGTKILLVGRHFYVKEDLLLDNGDQLYFLYDLPTKRGWCNADEPTEFPPLKAEMVEGVEFTEPVRLKNKM
jgi:hypothetical protein